jgi:hypothetical protein
MQEFGSAVLGGSHNAPHDIQVKEMSGKSRIEVAEELGIKFEIVPNIGKQDGIDAARAFIPRCRFDRVRTERGRLALISYHRVWDEKRRCSPISRIMTGRATHRMRSGTWRLGTRRAFQDGGSTGRYSTLRSRGAGHQWMGA